MIRRFAALFPALLLASLLFASTANAADEALALRIRASQVAAAGDCPQALDLLARARAYASDDARSALMTGQCLIQAKNYAEALPYLEEANRLDPDSGETALLLGVTQYRLGNLAGADAALTRAETLMPNSAEIELYRGLMLLEEARSDEASERFEHASRIGSNRVEPMASYYSGIAHRGAGRSEQGEAALRRVIELAPGSEWATQAQAVLDDPGTKQFALRKWLTLQAGLDYDSNVALVAEGIPVPAVLDGKSDGRGIWSASAGAEVFRNEDWGVGVLADYFGTAYFEDNEFNQNFIGGGMWVDRVLSDSTLLRVQPLVGFSWFHVDPFLNFYGVRTEILQEWDDSNDGTFYTRYSYDDYRYPISGATAQLRNARNRDGNNVLAGYDHTVAVGNDTVFFAGPFGRYFDAKGKDWDFWGLGLWAGVRQQLPLEFSIEIKGSYEYDHYKHASSFLLPGEKMRDRVDKIGTVSVELERPILSWLTATARYLYYNDDSNTQVFDYDRNVVGVFFTAAFGD